MSAYKLLSCLEKRGWLRGSVVDNGRIGNYYKDFAKKVFQQYLLKKEKLV
jgi:DNA-binding PadR family transcriptional regulator